MDKKMMYGVVSSTTAPLKKKPCNEIDLVDEVLMGMIVEIKSEEENGYYYVKTSYDYEGYLSKDDMIMSSEYPDLWADDAKNRLEITYCDVMKEGKFQSYPIAQIVGGSVINLTGNENEFWTEISLPDREVGWIRKEFVAEKIIKPIEDKEELRENLVATAKKYLKTQYRWGGRSNIGIDCSGLCSMSYMINGLHIFRDAVFKDEELIEITFDEMIKGDLIFYKGHIAMYIGDGELIHSTGSKAGVVIESLIKGNSHHREWLVNDIIKIGRHRVLL